MSLTLLVSRSHFQNVVSLMAACHATLPLSVSTQTDFISAVNERLKAPRQFLQEDCLGCSGSARISSVMGRSCPFRVRSSFGLHSTQPESDNRDFEPCSSPTWKKHGVRSSPVSMSTSWRAWQASQHFSPSNRASSQAFSWFRWTTTPCCLI